MVEQVLVIHERIGRWARQLRPRFSDRPVRVVETRSTADLEAAVAGVSHPLVVIDLARRVRAGMEDLVRVTSLSPEALVLVLDPGEHEGCAVLARESGATHVLAGPVTPPTVEALLSRWLTLARRRSESCGWVGRLPGSVGPEARVGVGPRPAPKPAP